MQGAVTIGAAIIADPGVNWQVRGAEALPGGGADILLQAQDGTVGLWDVNGGTLVGSTLLANPGTSWRADGLANFSGTGQPGIVLQNADGTIAIWETNGTAITSAALIGNPGVGWHVVGTGDVNGDGKADITLQNDNGAVEEWLMNGTSLISTATVSAAQAGWSVVGGGQMQFITANAAGTYAVDGAEQTFVVNAPPAGGITITGFNPAWDMIAVNGATIPNFAALQADTSNVGGAAVIALGGGATLTLPGVSPAQLLARNFSFQ